MGFKIAVAKHDIPYFKPKSENLVEMIVPVESKYWSELALLPQIVIRRDFKEDEIGLMHYRRMFQTEHFKEVYKDEQFGYEYGKESRPTLPNFKSVYENMTHDYKLDLDGHDLMVLEPFVKSRIKPLESLVELGWIDSRMVNVFYRMMKTKFEREWEYIEPYMTKNKEHYCNNIIYGKNQPVKSVLYSMFDILIELHKSSMRVGEHIMKPRCIGYFGEYIMRPLIEMYGYSVKEEKSICLVQPNNKISVQ